jgi:carotenoid cleavage dioxygenase
MSKGFEPIGFECDYANLVVEGEIPANLNGSFYRIGPNPQFAPRGNYNPLNGD